MNKTTTITSPNDWDWEKEKWLFNSDGVSKLPYSFENIDDYWEMLKGNITFEEYKNIADGK